MAKNNLYSALFFSLVLLPVLFIPLNITEQKPLIEPRPTVTATPSGTIPPADPIPVIPFQFVQPSTLECVERGQVVPCEVTGQD